MTADLQAFLDLGAGEARHAMIVFLRIAAAVALLPAFGERSIPVRVRLAIALAFTVVVAPIVADTGANPGIDGFLRLLASETLIGLVFGLGFRLLVMSLQIAGSIAAQSTSLAQIFGNASVEPMPAIGHVLLVAGLALAAMTGLHVRLTEAFVLSYVQFPAGILLDPGQLADFGVARVSAAFGLAVSLAAPFLLASFVYNFALGAINRAMPQLMVVLIGAPAITGASLAFLAIFSPHMLRVWMATLDQALANPFGLP
jgi:flagellar biosynthetic protein FliR